jgi:uncharacterized protein (TIGR02145 family)
MKKTIGFSFLVSLIFGTVLIYSCKKDPVIPTLTTSPLTNITINSVTTGGVITKDGGNKITYGVCWKTTNNPIVSDSHTIDGTGTGSFISNPTALLPGTTYYIRAYATNSAGTAYGNELIFNTNVADVDGNTYKTVTLGTQVWMAENLKTKSYSNSVLIGTTNTPTTNISLEATPKYQWAYDGIESNVAIYGRLYSWYAVTDSRNICPTGWHVPTDEEWETLKSYLGGELIAGGKLKETGTAHWQSPNTGATNETGFSALPDGYRNYSSFVSIQLTCYFWSSSQDLSVPVQGLGQDMHWNNGILLRGGYIKPSGCSVRCLRNL